MRQQKRLSPDRCSAERPASPDTCTRFPAEARVLRRHNTDAQWLTASLSSDEEFDRRMEEVYADEACYAWHDEPHVLILHPPHDRTIVPRHTCGDHAAAPARHCDAMITNHPLRRGWRAAAHMGANDAQWRPGGRRTPQLPHTLSLSPTHTSTV